MGNEGSTPDFDLKMPSLDLDLPEPTLNLDGPGGAPDLSMSELKLDTPLDLPGSGPAPKAATNGGKAGKKDKKANKKADKKADKNADKKKPKPEKKPKAPRQKMSVPKLPIAAMQNILTIVILLVIGGVMYLFEVPVNQVPDLTLTTYVQSLWLIIGCLFIMAMLLDIKTALIVTGIDIAMLATVFPTLWLLLDTPMNPLYFFVAGMIVLLSLVVLPLNLAKTKKPASVAKPASVPAAASAPTGPRTTS
jgi:cation transport ATPase